MIGFADDVAAPVALVPVGSSAAHAASKLEAARNTLAAGRFDVDARSAGLCDGAAVAGERAALVAVVPYEVHLPVWAGAFAAPTPNAVHFFVHVAGRFAAIGVAARIAFQVACCPATAAGLEVVGVAFDAWAMFACILVVLILKRACGTRDAAPLLHWVGVGPIGAGIATAPLGARMVAFGRLVRSSAARRTIPVRYIAVSSIAFTPVVAGLVAVHHAKEVAIIAAFVAVVGAFVGVGSA